MQVPQFLIYRGSTPTLELVLPVDISGSEHIIYATISQGGVNVLEYTNDTQQQSSEIGGSISVDTHDGTLILLSMTQEDTLLLQEGNLSLQLRVKNAETGDAEAFIPVIGYCGHTLKEGSI